MIRLDKYLSNSGICSRREASALIKQGRVSVNGKPAASNDHKLDESSDIVHVNGQLVGYEEFYYYMMNKPAGVLSATEDSAQETVLDLLSERERRLKLFPVGRLDKDTTGLILLTNNGSFAHKIISPAKEVQKRYHAKIKGTIDKSDIDAFIGGLVLGDGTKCLPAILEPDGDGACFVTIREGKYHQVKRMLASREKHVTELSRLSIGGLVLDASLMPGEYRMLTDTEKELIFQ